jgi:hypothetical protein
MILVQAVKNCHIILLDPQFDLQTKTGFWLTQPKPNPTHIVAKPKLVASL